MFPPGYSQPWYHGHCLEPPLGAGETAPADGRVGIVGGGLAGLATALGLTERGIDVVLFEQDEIGAGASGRNGGMISAGFNRSRAWLERRLERTVADRLHALSIEAVRLVERRIEHHAIACRPVRGVMEASFFAPPAGIEAQLERENVRFGSRLGFFSEAMMRESYRTDVYRCGVLDPDGLHLDPLALARGLGRAVRTGGGLVLEHCPVHGLRREKGGWRLATARGEARFETVVLCTNVYGRALWPRLARALLPVITYIIVTEPLGSRLGEIIRQPFAVFDDRVATGYYRPLPDGRLLWGGRVGLREHPPGMHRRLRRDLGRIYPGLADVAIDACWSGRMGFARHKMPLIRRLGDGLWTATAFGGHGLNTTTLAGEVLARALAGEGDDSALFAPFGPSWTGGIMGPLAAQLIYRGHAARDALKAGWQRRRNGIALTGLLGL